MSEQEMVKIAMRANGIEKPDRSLILGLPKIAEKYSKNRLRTPPTKSENLFTSRVDDFHSKLASVIEEQGNELNRFEFYIQRTSLSLRGIIFLYWNFGYPTMIAPYMLWSSGISRYLSIFFLAK